MKNKYFVFALAIILSSCNSTEKNAELILLGTWNVSEVISEIDNKSELNTLKKSVFNFYPDFTFAKIENRVVEHGNWSVVNENEIKFGNNRIKIDEFGDADTNNTLVVTLFNDSDSSKSHLILKPSPKLKDYKEEPFYWENNKWREKSSKKESNKEISDRLANYLLHNAYILKSAYERNDGTVSFANSKGIVKIFNGGIGIVDENKINESWKNTFYDDEDAMKAFYLYSTYLDKHGVLRGKSSGDWVKDDYEILYSVYSKVNSIKVNDEVTFNKIEKKAKHHVASL